MLDNIPQVPPISIGLGLKPITSASSGSLFLKSMLPVGHIKKIPALHAFALHQFYHQLYISTGFMSAFYSLHLLYHTSTASNCNIARFSLFLILLHRPCFALFFGFHTPCTCNISLFLLAQCAILVTRYGFDRPD